MALTPSTMLPLGTPAPDFSLPGVDGNIVTLDSFSASPVLVVAFICNHCPFVKHIRRQFAALTKEFPAGQVAFVAINSNDVDAYPEDDLDHMRQEAEEFGYEFPYLLDETQAVAKAYDAACTPDFFVFDQKRLLVYRGRFDASRPGNDEPVSGSDLRAALEAAVAGQVIPGEQQPSMGCNIKWKPGNEPA